LTTRAAARVGQKKELPTRAFLHTLFLLSFCPFFSTMEEPPPPPPPPCEWWRASTVGGRGSRGGGKERRGCRFAACRRPVRRPRHTNTWLPFTPLRQRCRPTSVAWAGPGGQKGRAERACRGECRGERTFPRPDASSLSPPPSHRCGLHHRHLRAPAR
jgi:hypothetical protein